MFWDAVSVAIGIVAGLITGLATGYYFERRQTRAARAAERVAQAESEQLTRELNDLKAAMTKLNVNVIGTMPGVGRSTPRAGVGTLTDDIAVAAKRMVDGTGRVRLSLIYEKFCAEEFTVEDVDAAIQALVDRNDAVRHREFLEVTT